MYHMSDVEKDAQVGKLALEYSEVKGHLNQLSEKMFRMRDQVVLLSQVGDIGGMDTVNGIPVGRSSLRPGSSVEFDGLLSSRELGALMEARKTKQQELDALAARLRAIAPHLL